MISITPYLYVPFAAWAIAQLMKFTLGLIRGDVNLRYLYASGGMPSVHSATICSLATWALIEGGPASPLFGITAVFAGIVMYDSFGVRRSAGENARALNKLISDLSASGGLRNADEYGILREILGHKPLEVIVGASLGILIAICFGYQKIVDQFPALFNSLSTNQAKVILIIGGVMLATAPLIYIYGLKKYHKQPALRSSLTYIALINMIGSLTLIFSAVLVYEDINTILSQWAVLGLIIIIWLLVGGIFKFRFYQSFRKIKTTPKDQRKTDWLKKAKSKKKKK